MPRLIYTFPILALLGLTSPAFAQEATADADTSETSQTEAAETSEDTGDLAVELDMGSEPQEEPTYIKEVFDDWELKCFRSEGEEDPCQMYQLLYEPGGSPVAEFSIFRLPGQAQATAGATLIVPLGTLLTEDVQISVDGGKAKSYSFRFCNLIGCYAQIGLTQDDVDAFRRGVTANLRIIPAQAPDEVVDIPVSLKGFTAAFDSTTVIDQ